MYKPRPLSREQVTSETLTLYVQEELGRVAAALALVSQGRFPIRYAEPDKKQLGMLAFADGTEWDPGSGVGYYYWNGSAWVAL